MLGCNGRVRSMDRWRTRPASLRTFGFRFLVVESSFCRQLSANGRSLSCTHPRGSCLRLLWMNAPPTLEATRRSVRVSEVYVRLSHPASSEEFAQLPNHGLPQFAAEELSG